MDLSVSRREDSGRQRVYHSRDGSWYWFPLRHLWPNDSICRCELNPPHSCHAHTPVAGFLAHADALPADAIRALKHRLRAYCIFDAPHGSFCLLTPSKYHPLVELTYLLEEHVPRFYSWVLTCHTHSDLACQTRDPNSLDTTPLPYPALPLITLRLSTRSAPLRSRSSHGPTRSRALKDCSIASRRLGSLSSSRGARSSSYGG